MADGCEYLAVGCTIELAPGATPLADGCKFWRFAYFFCFYFASVCLYIQAITLAPGRIFPTLLLFGYVSLPVPNSSVLVAFLFGVPQRPRLSNCAHKGLFHLPDPSSQEGCHATLALPVSVPDCFVVIESSVFILFP